MMTSAPIVQPGATVAVTGATGFIGRRLVERLAEQGAAVICLVRGTAGSTDLHDAGAKVCTLDLAEPEPLRAALQGVEYVFHCAYDWENSAWNFGALRALIAACRATGCRRLVHVSSFVVYQLPPDGEVTEDSAGNTSSTGYAHTKRELEAELLRAAREGGLPATIIQPTLVYGPHSRPWTIDPADMLRHGTVILPDFGEGTCHAVYVDDVVNAMILAANHPGALGQRFLVSGSEPITWRRFYEEIARAAGAEGPQYRPAEAIAREGGCKFRKLMRLAADPERVVRRISQSGSCRKLVQAGLSALPQGIRQSAQDRLFGSTTRRRGHVHVPNLGQLRFLQSRMTISSGKAKRVLGYAPQFDFAAGMVPTAHFLRHLYAKDRTT